MLRTARPLEVGSAGNGRHRHLAEDSTTCLVTSQVVSRTVQRISAREKGYDPGDMVICKGTGLWQKRADCLGLPVFFDLSRFADFLEGCHRCVKICKDLEESFETYYVEYFLYCFARVE